MFQITYFYQFGKRPQDYLQHQDGMSAQVLRESAIITKPFSQRMSRKSASRLIDPQSWTKINSSSIYTLANYSSFNLVVNLL